MLAALLVNLPQPVVIPPPGAYNPDPDLSWQRFQKRKEKRLELVKILRREDDEIIEIILAAIKSGII